MFNRFSRSSKLKGVIKPDPDSIIYFQEALKKDSGVKNLSSIELTPDNKIIIGTQRGEVMYFILDNKNNMRELYKTFRIQKGEVHRIVSISGVDTILIHVKSSLYLHFSQSGRSQNLSNYLSSFRVWRKQGQVMLYVAEAKQIQEIDLTPQAVDSNKPLEKGILWTFDDRVQKFMVNDKIVLAHLMNNTLVMKNRKNKKISHDYSFPLNHVMLHPLDQDIFLIILENQKFNLGICGNSRGGLSTKYQQTFDLTDTLRVSSVVDDGLFVVISTGNRHNIFSKNDGKLIQVIQTGDEAKEGKGYTLAINQETVVAISNQRHVLVFKPQSIDKLVNSSLTNKTYKTLISLVRTVIKDPKESKSYTSKIYQDFALKSFYNRQYDEAKECLGLYRFDPKEILEHTIEDYLPGQSRTLKSYSKDMRTFVLNLMKETRNNLLLLGENHVFPPDAVTRMKEISEPVSAREWLRLVDFALIRSFYGLNKFDDLFEFLRTKKKIYCFDVEDLKGLLFDVENNEDINSFLRYGILSELHFLFKQFDRGLTYLGKLNLQFSKNARSTEPPSEQYQQRLAKYKHLFNYTFEKAISVLVDFEKEPNFLKTLVTNLLWIRSNKQKMQDLFSKLTFNEQSIKEMKKELEKIKNEEVKLSIWDVFLGKLFETEGLNQADINSDFLIKNFESLKENPTKLGFERALKILQDKTRVFDYYRVYQEFLKLKSKLTEKKDLAKGDSFIMRIQIEILKNLDEPKYHRQAIEIMLEKEEFELAEAYCANYEKKEETEKETIETGDALGTENYFGM